MEYIENWLWQDIQETSSTNDAVKELCSLIEKPCVVTAEHQTAGRGRRGRAWTSMEGNLFLSLAFKADCRHLGQLVIMSGLAVFKTVKYFCPKSDIRVKWPNDVLAEGAKISGILFERGEKDFWIMGVGINIVANPTVDAAGYQTASLNGLGAKTSRIEVLRIFLQHWNALQEAYILQGFEPLKQTWLDNAYNLGKKIMIKQEKEIKEGIFTNLDDEGCLILQTDKGFEKIIVGDLFIKKEKNE